MKIKVRIALLPSILFCLAAANLFGAGTGDQVQHSTGPAKTGLKISKILFLGNSITLHGPLAAVDWSGNWGMAASAQDKDFAHVMIHSISDMTGIEPEAMIQNISDFEKHSESYDIAEKLRDELAFNADVVVLGIGENVPALNTEAAKAKFKQNLGNLLQTLKADGNPAIYVRSTFWPNAIMDDILQKECERVGGVFVDISNLSKDESNYARSERQFKNIFVAKHPGDKGMLGIANALLEAIKNNPPTQRTDARPRVKLGAYYFEGWSGHNKADGDPDQPWAKGAPTHLTKSLAEDFDGRQPLWGWRDDTAEIMRQQIDLAADNGLSFWAFCWYFNADPKQVAENPRHTGLRLYLAATNNNRLKFCLLVANHGSYYELKTLENWRKAADYWLPYLTNPHYLLLGGKPLVILFNPTDALPEGMMAVEQAAKAAGLPGVAFAGCGTNLPASFAAATEYNVNGGWMKGWREENYGSLLELHRQSWRGTATQPVIPCAIVGFDRRPWETAQQGSYYYTGQTPELFGQHIRDLITWMDNHPNQVTPERIALVYAWNEIGEGGYLMPTRGDPDASYLKALKSALSR